MDTDASPDKTTKLDAAQQLNIVLSAVAIVAALSFGLGGATLHLPAAIVLALLPAILVYLLRREPLLYALRKPRSDPRTDLSLAILACGFGLIYGNRDVHFVETQMLFEYAGLVALLLCGTGVFSATWRTSQFWSTMFSLFIFAAVYGWGLAATVDSMTDRSAPMNYTTMVETKYEAHGRGTAYHLDLAPWGPFQKLDDLSVSDETYERTSIGSQVCLELHRGLLHVQWYRTVECDRGM